MKLGMDLISCKILSNLQYHIHRGDATLQTHTHQPITDPIQV